MNLRIVAPIFLALLGACGGGGGGGGGGSQVSQTTVSGTVAADAALADYDISVFAPIEGQPTNSTSVRSASGRTGPDGRYAATSFLGTVRPFLIFAAPVVAQGSANVFHASEIRYGRLFSVSLQETANVTPLTTLLVNRLVNRRLTSPDVVAANELQNRSPADIATARQQVLTYLMNRPDRNDGNATSPVDVSAVTDFALMPLTPVPGDPHFDALKLFHDSLMDSETLEGVMEHMLFGNDAPMDPLGVFALDFMADCTTVANGGLIPPGAAHVVLDLHAIAFGSTEFAFQTGDKLHIDAGGSSFDRWLFTLGGTQSLQFNIDYTIVGEPRLSGVHVFDTSNRISDCAPQGAVSLSGKHPTRFPAIGLLRQSIAAPMQFQCAGPITFPGFLAGTNAVAIEGNGALRVNGTGGPSLHLPSQGPFSLNASIVVVANQVSSLQLTSFGANRSFRVGVGPTGADLLRFDGVTIALDNTGLITGFRLDRGTVGSSQTQSCGTI